MKCPYCGHNKITVKMSYHVEKYDTIRRGRRCQRCGKGWTTHEYITWAGSIRPLHPLLALSGEDVEAGDTSQ
jgi:transcriptional regulator NrdR family protein